MSAKTITAAQVKELRAKSGVSVMECKKALEKTHGDLEKALAWLKQRGREKAVKKAARTTSEGIIASYIHSNRKVGAMVELRSETDFVAKNKEFQDLAYDLAMHVAAMAPKYLSFSDVGQKEKDEYEHLSREELALAKKPADVVEKIIEGKTKKHFSEMSLMSQAFVKKPEMTIDELVKEKILKIGENIQIENFIRFEI
ncbi:MAG: elongation factor Ts [Candidatus Moranbacteria bacterium RBG_13_45_13]|nr:MAG: elongation factor Ts [Candidatus Moranbacteria bacterium RBG_13_45_13]